MASDSPKEPIHEDWDHRPDAERRLRQADRVARALRVLLLLTSGRPYNRESLAAEEECDVRTVSRTLQILELAGVPTTYDRPNNRYRLSPTFQFPVVRLSRDELLGQATATALTASPELGLPNGAKPATQRIAATDAEAAEILADAANLISVLSLNVADHSRHRQKIQSIQWALLERKQVAGQYRSPYEPRAKRLRLHPVRICLIKQAWYLIGRPHNETQPKTYRVARFQTLKLLDTAAEVPGSFDLRAYLNNAWSVCRGDRSYDVELLFNPVAAPLVVETTWHHTQKATHHRDGSVTLTFTVDGLDEILWWVLGWGGRVQVLAPPELKQRVRDQLQQARDLHE